MKVNNVVNGFKAFIRNLPVIRKELAAAITASLTLVGAFEVSFPQVSMIHLVFFASLTAILTGTITFLNNSKVAQAIEEFSDRPIWKAKLMYMACAW